MIPTVQLSAFTFSSGEEIALDKGDVVVIVGPNNAGKSRALADIILRIKGIKQENLPTAVKECFLVKEGSAADVRTLLESLGSPMIVNSSLAFNVFEQVVQDRNVEGYWRMQNTLHELTRLFCLLVDTEQRLGITKPPASIPLHKQGPKHPIHILQRDPALE